jgi:hypothetical protein
MGCGCAALTRIALACTVWKNLNMSEFYQMRVLSWVASIAGPKTTWLLAAALAAASSQAAVVEVKVESRQPVLAGAPFGEAGAYERLDGTVTFALDPGHGENRKIVDLDHAPRNSNDQVLATANFMVLQPREKASGVAILEVSNRGGKAMLPYFQSARFANDPARKEDFGDGLLMRQGYTLMWVGWQADVPQAPLVMRLNAPVAKAGTDAIEGLVRADWTIEKTTATLALSHRDHVAYPVSDPASDTSVLTERDGRDAARRIVPRGEWRFAQEIDGKPQPDATHIYKRSGFLEGKIYELVYRARDPRVVGMGLASVRDFMSYAKYDNASPFKVKHAIAFGVSQTGRFLRHFLYQGFNSDERERQVFDGMFIHAAGAGRGSFNHRFAQPSRDAHRFSTFLFPTDLFPFSSRAQRDPESDASGGIMPARHAPKVFYTNTGYEYWGRAASLIHTTPDGKRDIEPLANERIFHLASGQHFVVPFPPEQKLAASDAYFGNPLDYLVNLRALMQRLVEWVARDREPPESAYPRIADKTLVAVEQLKFPNIAGLDAPHLAHEAYRVDYGPRWLQGIIDNEPPKVGKAFTTLVPQVDEFGNELGGIRNVEIRAPLATYTPWCLRLGLPGPPGELVDFYGTFTPLPASANDKDARPAIGKRFDNRNAYLANAKQAAQELVREGYLLEEDVARVLARAEKTWGWVVR